MNPPPLTEPRQHNASTFLFSPWLLLPLLAVAVLILYVPSLSNWGAVDDLTHLRKALVNEAFAKTFFRPLERFVNQLNVAWLGYDDLRLSLTVNLAGFLLTIVGTFFLGRALYARSVAPALFASLLVALSSLSVSPSLQIDSISQQYATVFSLGFFLALCRATRLQNPIWYIVAFSAASLALISKETAFGIIATIPFAVFLVTWSDSRQTTAQKWRSLAYNCLSFIAIFGIYLLLRISLGYVFSGGDSGTYALSFSLARLLKNAALYFSSLLYLGGSTLDILPTLKPWHVALSGLFTLTLFALAAIGIIRTVLARSSTALVFIALFLLTLVGAVPVILTEQVSELYSYSSLPFFALFVSLGFIRGVTSLGQRWGMARIRSAALIFCLALCVWLTFGSYEKIAALGDASDQSWRYFTQANTFLETAPAKTLRLCWAEDNAPTLPTYSVFIRPPKLLAERAIEFAAFLKGKTVTYPEDQAQSALGASSSQPPCTYQMALVEGQMQFSPPR